MDDSMTLEPANGVWGGRSYDGGPGFQILRALNDDHLAACQTIEHNS
jgi:hypothetical protein